MTTRRQIKAFVKPLLERHGDLAAIDGWIVLKPVHHIARGILIDRTSSASRCRPHWMVLNLIVPRTTFGWIWGERIFHPQKGLWEWSRPGLADALVEAAETTTLPMLRSVETLSDLRTFASSQDLFLGQTFPAFHLDRLAVEIALGELEAARATYDLLTTKPSRFYGTERYIEMTARLGPLLAADDRDGMAALLHEWEARSVQVLKLEQVWERTPFPLEKMG